MITNSQLAKIITKQYKKLSQEEIRQLKTWSQKFPFFKKLKDQDQKIFLHLIRFFHFTKISPGQPLALSGDQICEFIYVIKGEVSIDNKRYMSQANNKRKKKRQVKSQFLMQNIETLCQNQHQTSLGQSIITSSIQSQIVYITSKSLEKVINDYEYQKATEKINILIKHNLFSDLDKSMIRQIAESCQFREFYLNNYIFKYNQSVGPCYILLEGNIKIQRPQMQASNQNTKLKFPKIQMTILTPQQVFGEEQLLFNMEKRYNSALCITQKVKVLQINDVVFVKVMSVYFSRNNNQTIQHYEAKRLTIRKKLFEQNSIIHKKMSNTIEQQYILPQLTTNKNLFKPRLNSFDSMSNKKNSKNITDQLFDSQQSHQYQLIKNSHQLLQAKIPKGLGVVRSQDSTTINPFTQKFKLYKKLVNNFPKIKKESGNNFYL